MKNYYSILEVNENASREVIDKAYRVLVRRYHPDIQGNSPQIEKKIREINEAYSVLSDEFLKEQYDEELKKERKFQPQDNYMENDYGRMYREQQRLKHELAHEKYDKERISHQKQEYEEEINRGKNTSSNAMISILQTLFRHRPTLQSIKKLDFLALALTIIIVLTIGAVLYFLPFTHNWMYDNFLNTPLTRWMFK